MRLAGQVLRRPEQRPANVDINWVAEDEKDLEEDHRRLGVQHFQEIYTTWQRNDPQRRRNLVSWCSNENWTN